MIRTADMRALPFLAFIAVTLALGSLPSRGAAQSGSEIPPPLELVAPGLVSTEGGEAFPAMPPDGMALYFATHERGWTGFNIVVAALVEGSWGRPQTAPFNSSYNDRAPSLSPDGRELFFSSDRPLPGAIGRGGDFNLWVVRLVEEGSWSEPQAVPGVNSRGNDFHSAVTTDGTLYFSSDRPGGHGQYDLYRAERTADGYAEPVNLGPPINTAGEETDVFVSPDDGYLILVATEREGGFGGDDLWLSLHTDGDWSSPVNLGEPVNSDAYEYGPFISPDGRFLYLTTHRRGLGDIVRVPSAPSRAWRRGGPDDSCGR
jgi:Tol biopolymer transport system component